ncbi:methionyl-tRNA formyltransferase [Flavihumibacter profundi]|jgi:methionyl-tRNA formyltransferase|uniref:methionyl-tRNA formyltransferase n=1 Tax=Flavihumibacter profundi TaxID=2716883 RepID=UPI001CC4439B|nr:methionyl-tRNA formyltransferase [Flavihumibacter profundi]MBZ5857234.1 methionyl-tRNA formyltransferase [Flavihumibacter profundi]
MDYRQLRIVFMGTPEFAVASLDALVKGGCRIVGVITAPDKPAGRGMQLQQSAVKQYAVAHHLNVLQPVKLKDPLFVAQLKALKADLQVVVAFRMLPEIVWNMPPLGTINVHGSLLPQYRGAAPINWAIINGETETGVTTFKLRQEIDTGNILMHAKLDIGENETAGSLHDRMKLLGADLLLETINELAAGELEEITQSMLEVDPLLVRTAPKIFTETCRINWEDPIDKIYNLIRGLSPYPAAFTELDGKKLKIFAASKEYTQPAETPGAYATDHKSWLKFAGPDGYLFVTDIQLEGKKRMPVTDFLRGYRFPQNDLS